jgi:YidC/Oxa1 family membrane protein insertase
MEKRAIMAIVLSLLVVVVWSIVFKPSPSPPIETPPVEPQTRELPQSTSESRETRVQKTPSQETSLPQPRSVSTPTTLVTVDTGVAQLVLNSQGASVKAVHLLDYRASLEKGAPPTEIAPVPEGTTAPLTTELNLGSRTLSLAGINFEPSAQTLTLSKHQPEGVVMFRGQMENGDVIERMYRFRYGRYVFELSTRVEGTQLPVGSAMTLTWGPGLRQQHEEATRRRRTGTQPRSYISGKIFTKVPEKAGETLENQGQVSWAALADTYFAAVLIPQQPAADAVVVRHMQEGELTIGLRTPLEATRAVQTVQVYVGPKDQRLLEAVDSSLGKLIDLGFFSPLARPMMQLLRLIYYGVHNYGVAIIVVTLLIKIVFWPLTQKSYKSMQAMQKLQPKMKEMQAVYKDDRQALNRAMMQLYRENKVNPMGGCLPMLLQIPFFFAFYNALLYSIELRHAPFICWETKLFWVGRGICDLSVHDPSYITPVLMGITMFAQQKMTPTTGDPTQAKMMQFMPLIFLFFFLKAPAGLVIYWLMNNLLSIAQQLLINRARHQEAAQAEATSKG